MGNKRTEYFRQYREQNREKINAYHKQWAKENPEKVKQYKARYKAKRKGAAQHGTFKEIREGNRKV